MSIQTVIKRDGKSVPYDANKIKIAIQKANKEVQQSERVNDLDIDYIVASLESLNQSTLAIEGIQDFIEAQLMRIGKYELAKTYMIYRYNRALLRKANSTDESILALVQAANKAVGEENANKNPRILATQRDLIAGEVSKDIAARILLPEHLVRAHQNGEIHFHDMDYYIQGYV